MVESSAVATPRPMTIRNMELQRLYSLWYKAADGYRMPDPGWLSPIDLTDYLHHMLHVEVEHEPERYRYRKVGMELQRLYGKNPEGRYIDEMPNPLFRRVASAAYREVVQTRAPTCSTQRFMMGMWFASYERLLLPFSADGTHVTSVIGCIMPRIGRLKGDTEETLLDHAGVKEPSGTARRW